MVHATDYLRWASGHCARTSATAQGDLARLPDPVLSPPPHRLCKEKGICEEHDSFLYNSSGQMYVPDNNSLRMHIISSHHDSPVAGHLGYQKTQELIERQYYWPGLASDIRTYVPQCNRCACFKGSNTKPTGSAVPLQPSTMPWVDVSVDFITDLPLSNGFDSILTVID